MTSTSQRGSGLLLAIIVVVVIAAISVGVLRYTSRELAGASAGRQADALVACAEAGRQLLLSQFRSVGISPTQLEAMNVPLDGSTSQVRSVGGHISETAANVQIAQVTVLPLGTFGSERRNTRDITNIAFPNLAPLGGKPYRVMVHCEDHGRQLEVEFGVRFGL